MRLFYGMWFTAAVIGKGDIRSNVKKRKSSDRQERGQGKGI